MRASSFGRALSNEVPRMLTRTRASALKEFNEFLASLRHASPKVGQLALEMTQERSYREESGKKQATRYAAVAKARDQLDLRALDIDTASQGQTDSLPLRELGIDFGPIFRCFSRPHLRMIRKLPPGTVCEISRPCLLR